MPTLQEHYRRMRAENPNAPAHWAIDWARDAIKVDALRAVIDWHGEYHGDGYPMRFGDLPCGVTVVIWPDEEPYDWGDIEPTEFERENLQVIGVAVRITGEDDDLDAIWGVGYLNGDAESNALQTAIEHGFIDTARDELRERAEWAARDTITV